MDEMEKVRDALQRIVDAIRAAADAILEVWENGGIKKAIEQVAAMAVEVEKIKPKEREKPLRPHRNTINRQYKQPTRAVRHTARSRLR